MQGSGTQDDPFLITNGADLAYIAKVVNESEARIPNFSGKYFKMTQSIDLNCHNLNIGDFPGWADRKGFYGMLDGNHCTIRGLNNTKSLFGTIETGYLKNLSVYGKVNGNDTIGGIVGYAANGGVLENLTNYATVSGVSTLGGVVGNSENQASTVINCVNYGDVTSTGNDCVGGIAGSTKNTGSIKNCYNYGDIKARGKIGGIVGQANKLIEDCVSYGSVSGTWAIGGIVGYTKSSDSVSIVDCVNNGSITASSTGVGGIFGILETKGDTSVAGRATITGCTNNGSVEGSWGVGGIAGDTIDVTSQCVNNGSISAKGEVAGIVGKCYGNVTECTNNGDINGVQAIVGGIVGHLHVTTYIDVINTTNYQNGSVTGANPQEIIGKIE